MSQNPYADMSQEDFDRHLLEIAEERGARWLITAVPGVYELVAEELNNEVLDAWTAAQESETKEDE